MVEARDFRPRDRVRHRDMGLGRVVSVKLIKCGADDDEVVVAYDNGGDGRYDALWFQMRPSLLDLHDDGPSSPAPDAGESP